MTVDGEDIEASVLLAIFNDESPDLFRSSCAPIYQTTTFYHESFSDLRKAMRDEDGYYLYTRGRNPTVQSLETKLARMEMAESGKLFSSGVSAIAAASLAFLKSGDHVVCVRDCYSWANTFFASYISRFNIRVTFVEGVELADWEAAISEDTRLFYLESPTTFSLKIQDLTQVSELARKNGIKTIVDNTWATPIFQNPIKHGIDLVVHSCTKYIGGHNDVIGGVVLGSAEDIDHIYKTEFLNIGAIPSPMECWLLERGLRTLPLRVTAQAKSVARVVEFLFQHPLVDVVYPHHPSHPQFELAKNQMRGGTSLFTIQLKAKSPSSVELFVNSLKRFKKTVGWGGFHSLVLPAAASSSCPEEYMKSIRVYVGLEPTSVLIDDLEQALDRLHPAD